MVSPKDDSQTEEKQAEGEKIEDLILLFTVAYKPIDNQISFIGNMPVAQAMGLIQTILANAEKEEMRKDIIAELNKKKGKAKAKAKAK